MHPRVCFAHHCPGAGNRGLLFALEAKARHDELQHFNELQSKADCVLSVTGDIIQQDCRPKTKLAKTHHFTTMNKRADQDEDMNNCDGTSGDVAVIGESSNSTQVSIQTLQGIYNELTGKSEQVGKSYNKPIRVQFSDIEQLNHKIKQACEQYNVVSGNCSATVYYVDDTRDQFSSF